MKRYAFGSLALLIWLAASALGQIATPPSEYADEADGNTYYHGDSSVTPVYDQPLHAPAYTGGSHVNAYDVPIEPPEPNGYASAVADGCLDCGGCGDCGLCEAAERDCIRPWDMWVRGEYLIWWTQGNRLPPLATTATGSGSGLLDEADTRVVIGDTDVHQNDRGGGRFSIGAWLNPEHCSAVEVNFFFLDDSEQHFQAVSDTTPVLSRPFFNVEQQTNAVQRIAAPGISSGFVVADVESDVNGGEVLIRRRLDNHCDSRVEFLYGYRYAGLDERLRIEDSLTSLDPTSNIPVGTVVSGFDSFETFNQFHGGDLGMAIDLYHRGWTLGLVGKVALGNMREQVTIGGNTLVSVPGQDAVESAGGLLTQPSNIGGFVRDEFAVIPEAQVNVRVFLSKNLEVSVGYTFIYYSEVVRPAEQIDLAVDPRQITDPANASAQPAFDFVSSDFWLQGVNFGVEYKF
jgi:hypothetical protein